MEIESVVGDYKKFITNLTIRFGAMSISIDDYPIDHVCFRVVSMEEYRALGSKLISFSSEVARPLHNGREFSIFRLIQPLLVERFSIPLLELPAPSKGQPYATGFEHAEVVINPGFQDFCEVNRNNLLFDDDMNAPNATARITFEDGTTLKFHAITLSEAVHLQGDAFRPAEQD